MAKFLKNFPHGPLDIYRVKASFEWKRLKTYIFTDCILEYQHNIYEELQKHPLLLSESFQVPSLDEERRISVKQMNVLRKLQSLSLYNSIMFEHLHVELKILLLLNCSTTARSILTFILFSGTLKLLGTGRHSDYVEDTLNGDVIGSFCMTEFSHGSNIQALKTVATYDINTKEFILNSPSFEAAKCWAGNLGQTATHAIVYAQLITPDGVNHSVHPFIVKIRDPQTFIPYPGVIVGDMGEKIGLNGLDNGFVMFNNYRIPRTDLLNKTGDVAEDGTYVTPYKDRNKKYGTSLGALSFGRVLIIGICSAYATQAVTIAVRYAAVRKQFGPDGDDEIPILEYQSHQHRIIPYLSMAYVLEVFSNYLGTVQIQSISGDENAADFGLELHAISSGCKPLAGWMVRDAVQECREACAGHGYLKAAGLGDIRNSNDANCTAEGENHILIQQTSNWLLRFWPIILRGDKINFPLKSVDFLMNAQEILKNKFNFNSVEEVMKPENIINMYQWLVCFLLKASYEKCELLMTVQKLDSVWAKNESQVYYLKNLAIVYIQHFMIQRINTVVSEAEDPSIKNVLEKVLSLYGVWTLEKYMTIFYQGRYASDPRLINFIHTAVLNLCKDLKNDAIALVDVIAPPDFLLKSVLGNSDGMVYKHLQNAIFQNPGALSRPEWWNEIRTWQSKL